MFCVLVMLVDSQTRNWKDHAYWLVVLTASDEMNLFAKCPSSDNTVGVFAHKTTREGTDLPRNGEVLVACCTLEGSTVEARFCTNGVVPPWVTVFSPGG